jgi:hypothetical protein
MALDVEVTMRAFGLDPICHVSSRKWPSNALTQHDDEDYL